jgi:transposase
VVPDDGRSEMQVAVGIDVAKEFHWAAAVDERGGEFFSRRVENEPAAIEALVDQLEQLRLEHRRVTVGIDVVGGIASLLTVTPAEIRRAGRTRLVNHLLKAGRLPRPQIERLSEQALAAAKAQQLALPGERLAAELVRELAREALAVRDRLTRLDRQIEETLARHPDAALIRSLPGMGATLTAEFIAEAGGIARFPTPDRLAAAAGLAPILKQSGKVRYLQRARGGNKALKRVLYQSAFCSLSHPASRAFYTRKRREGKRHHQAVIALARRRVDVLHAILRTRQPYRHQPAKAA